MSKHEWKPGDVAAVTEYGDPIPAVFSAGCKGRHIGSEHWCYLTMTDQGCTFTSDLNADARPLVVIDPEDMQQIKGLIRALRRVDMLDPSWDEDVTRAGVTKALRSLVAPPKPAEPRGLGAVVEDADGDPYVRHCYGDCEDRNACIPWTRVKWGTKHTWNDVPAAKVIAKGVDR